MYGVDAQGASVMLRVSGFFNHLYVQLRPGRNPTTAAAADPSASLTAPLVGAAATAAAETLAPGNPNPNTQH